MNKRDEWMAAIFLSAGLTMSAASAAQSPDEDPERAHDPLGIYADDPETATGQGAASPNVDYAEDRMRESELITRPRDMEGDVGEITPRSNH